MNNTRLELIVGSFVLLAVAVFFVIIFFVSGVYFLKDGYTINTEFAYAAGLTKGAPVKMAGVGIGEVQAVDIVYDKSTNKPLANVSMWVEEGVQIRKGSEAHIFGAFALNETHVEIISNGSSDGSLLRDGDKLKAVDHQPMELLVQKGEEIAEGLSGMSKMMDRIIGDKEVQDRARETIVYMGELLEIMNRMMKEKGDSINNLIDDAEVSVDRLSTILDKIEKGDGTVGKLIGSDELYQEMRDFVKEIKTHPWRLMKKDKKDKDKKGILPW